jgi:glycosyltransferase involved in cell wall biosynthesis
VKETATITVVLPIRLATETIESTLESLFAQVHDYAVEVIAVVCEDDPTLSKVAEFRRPNFRYIAVRGEHGVPYLRGCGVRASRAEFVLIAEDHCLFPENWIRSLVGAIERTGADVSGGPVTNGRYSWVGWAQYFTRYSSFMPPVADGAVRSLPGNNACYRRADLEAHDALLEDGFWEAELNSELSRSGRVLWSCSTATVVQRQQRGMIEYLPLRFRHGRCYGARRLAASPQKGIGFVAMSSVVPFLLLFRTLRAVFAKKYHRLRLVATLPLVAIYFVAWSLGEMTGYLAGAGDSCQATD